MLCIRSCCREIRTAANTGAGLVAQSPTTIAISGPTSSGAKSNGVDLAFSRSNRPTKHLRTGWALPRHIYPSVRLAVGSLCNPNTRIITGKKRRASIIPAGLTLSMASLQKICPKYLRSFDLTSPENDTMRSVRIIKFQRYLVGHSVILLPFLRNPLCCARP
jgi:hypothetical protein